MQYLLALLIVSCVSYSSSLVHYLKLEKGSTLEYEKLSLNKFWLRPAIFFRGRLQNRGWRGTSSGPIHAGYEDLRRSKVYK